MKKAFVLTLALAAGVTAFAQNKTGNSILETGSAGAAKPTAKQKIAVASLTASPSGTFANKTQAVIDTAVLSNVLPPYNTLDSLVAYRFGTPNWGSFSGTGSLGLYTLAERFDVVGLDSFKVESFTAAISGAVRPTSTDTITAFVCDSSLWSAGLTGSIVDAWIGAAVDTTFGFAGRGNVRFPSFPMTSGTYIKTPSFYVGVALERYTPATVLDTFIFWHTPQDARPADDTLIHRNIYFRTNANNQSVFGDFYGFFGLRVNLWMFPIITFDTTTQVGIDKGVAKNGLLFSGIYPNPATDFSKVRFSLNTAADVTIKIFDIKGVEVMSLEKGRMSAGAHEEILDVTALPAGVYSVGVSNGSAIIGGRLTVSK